MTGNSQFISFKEGKESGFRYYYETYYHALCQWVISIIKDDSRMHDFVQEAFIILWKHRDSIESEVHMKMFLYQVVRNCCFNFLKSKKLESKYMEEYFLENSEEEFQNKVIEEEVFRLIMQEIDSLPPEQKTTVLLHLEGRNNIEIAEILHVSVNTVKTHKARARKRLKERLGELYIVICLLGL